MAAVVSYDAQHIYVETRYGDPAVTQLKQLGAHWSRSKKLWELSVTMRQRLKELLDLDCPESKPARAPGPAQAAAAVSTGQVQRSLQAGASPAELLRGLVRTSLVPAAGSCTFSAEQLVHGRSRFQVGQTRDGQPVVREQDESVQPIAVYHHSLPGVIRYWCLRAAILGRLSLERARQIDQAGGSSAAADIARVLCDLPDDHARTLYQEVFDQKTSFFALAGYLTRHGFLC
jgi:hypothetical protein